MTSHDEREAAVGASCRFGWLFVLTLVTCAFVVFADRFVPLCRCAVVAFVGGDRCDCGGDGGVGVWGAAGFTFTLSGIYESQRCWVSYGVCVVYEMCLFTNLRENAKSSDLGVVFVLAHCGGGCFSVVGKRVSPHTFVDCFGCDIDIGDSVGDQHPALQIIDN